MRSPSLPILPSNIWLADGWRLADGSFRLSWLGDIVPDDGISLLI